MIHWELCKRLKFDNADQRHYHKPGLLNCKMLNSPDTHWVLLARLASMAKGMIHGFRYTEPFLIFDVLVTQAKFLKIFIYCNMIKCAFTFYTINVLEFFCGIIVVYRKEEQQLWCIEI